MYNFVVTLIPVGLLLTSVTGSIELQEYEVDTVLSTTTTELLSSFKHCIVFIFDWNYNDDYEFALTSTNYFVFYSETLSCSLVVETNTQYRKTKLWNPRFLYYEPHPLFTKYTGILLNLYSSEATSTDRYRVSTTNKIWKRISTYNIPFSYVLIFMSTERFFSVDSFAMFEMFPMVSIPAVYILVLDEYEIYVVGFAQVMRSAPFLFKVTELEESYIQHLHELVHKDLQKLKISIYGEEKDFLHPHCEFGSPILAHPNDCALSALMKYYNLTYCITSATTCVMGLDINFIHTVQYRDFYLLTNRSYVINVEFINYLVDVQEFSFVCIVQPGSMGFMAFVRAFDQSTWIAAGVAFVCLTLTVAAMSNKRAATWWSKLQPSAVLVLMLFFERFYASSLLSRAASRQSILVLTLWAFAAMLLGMSYSGNMISELAAPSLPPMPQDMHELSLVDYPVFTDKRAILFFQDVGDSTVGYLHSEIREYLRDSPGKIGTLKRDLQRLNTSLTLRPLKDIVREYHGDSRKSAQLLFAFADGPVEVKAVGLWSEMTNTRLITSRGRKLPFFDRPQQLFVHTNFLLPILRKYYAKVFEFGSLRFWQKGYEAELLGDVTLRLLEGQSIWRKSSVQRIGLATIWRSFDALKESNPPPTEIDLDNLSPAFQLLVIGLSVAAIVLLHERWPLKLAIARLFDMAHKLLTIICRLLQYFGILMRRQDPRNAHVSSHFLKMGLS